MNYNRSFVHLFVSTPDLLTDHCQCQCRNYILVYFPNLASLFCYILQNLRAGYLNECHTGLKKSNYRTIKTDFNMTDPNTLSSVSTVKAYSYTRQ